MANQSDRRQTISIIWLLAIASTAGAIASIYLSWTGKLDGVAGLGSDLLIFISTVLISYLITNNNERARFEKEMQKLANFSRRRVDLTTANIEALSNELPEIDDLKEMHRLVAFTLRNLAADSGASLKEIEEMGYVDSDDSEEAYKPKIIIPRKPSTEEQVDLVSEGPSGSVTFSCASCGSENSTDLKLHPGTTKVVECKNCGNALNVHRLGNGETKVVNRWANRSSGVVRSYHNVPKTMYRRVAQQVHFDPTPVNANCPRCGNSVHFPGNPNKVIEDRFCFGCQANVTHDQASGEVGLGKPYEVKLLENLSVGRFHCDCGLEFSPTIRKTDEDEEFFCCLSCHSIYKSDAKAKQIVQRKCASDGCENDLTFKVDPTTKSGKQVCYECKSRLEYDENEDSVRVIEVLDIPKLQRSEYLAGGSICPKCEEPAGSQTLQNAAGEKFHMHWACKYPFQLLDE